MRAEFIDLAELGFGFLITFARVSAMLAFVPLPGWRAASDPVRAALAFALTFCLMPRWPSPGAASLTASSLIVAILAEATVGLAVGVATSLVLDTFALGAQLTAIQAGYSYASTVDPTSQADSNVLQALSQLFASLLMLSLGLDRWVIRALASPTLSATLFSTPDGLWACWQQMQVLGAAVWSAAFRLAAPLLLLLLTADIVLSCAGRINAHLQLLAVAFPAKILLTLGALAMLAGTVPTMFRQQAQLLVEIFGVR